MELKFNKNGDAWVAEFEATDKFNLHMEGLLLGSFSILQRTAGGKYTHVRDIPTYPRFDKVFDYDFNALVYPKFIKIVSETEPTYAEVVSDGEITEIKSQTKEVEITANGTTQVAPDAGFSYLTGVSIKTNVPQSGGSGGGGETSSMEYWDISGIDLTNVSNAMAIKMASLFKVYSSATNVTAIAPYGLMTSIGLGGDISTWDMSYVAIDLSVKVVSQNRPVILGDMLTQILGAEVIASIPRITEEEFYNLG